MNFSLNHNQYFTIALCLIHVFKKKKQMIIKYIIDKILKSFVVICFFYFLNRLEGRDTRTERSDVGKERKQYPEHADRNMS